MHFDATVSIGNVITLVVLLGALWAAIYRNDKAVAVLAEAYRSLSKLLETEIEAQRAYMQSQITNNHDEIASLREWRHKFGPKEMLVDQAAKDLTDLELRVRELENR